MIEDLVMYNSLTSKIRQKSMKNFSYVGPTVENYDRKTAPLKLHPHIMYQSYYTYLSFRGFSFF